MKLVVGNSCARHEIAAVPEDCAQCAVREIAVCTALSAPELERLRSIAVTKLFEPGSTLFAADEAATLVGTVVQGTIKCFKLLADGRQQIIGFLFPGDFIGSPTQETTHGFAEALTKVELCLFPFPAIQRLIHEMPNLERRLLTLANEDLDLAREWMLLLGRKTAQERLATFLLLLAQKAKARGIDANGIGGGAIDLPMNRSEIADYLGLSLETVSRQFTKLKSSGHIRIEHNNAITIRNLDGLIEIAEGMAERPTQRSTQGVQ
ncbi:Crp/Fnr family transcriptional regulator [Dongia sp.]|uniref:Crp/Fnr family transcriptional regulator n=1 Tax=Dongia sp. TaxID=1977262 RepID=UPI00375161CC